MKGLVVAIDVGVAATWFFSVYFIGLFPATLAGTPLIFLLAGYLAIIWTTYPPGRLRLQWDQASSVALLAGAAYLAVTYEPAFVVHSVLLPAPTTSVAETVVYSVLFGAFLQSFLFNLNFANLFKRRRPGAVVLPFALFLILFLPLSTLQTYASAAPPQILTFVIINLFGGTALFVVLLILYVKSNFGNLPGFVFYFATAIPTIFVVLLAANPILLLLWLFVAFGVAIMLVELLLPATWAERRLLPVSQGVTHRSSQRSTYITIGAIGAIVVTLFLVLPAVLGTPHPYLADATGSMAPQIEPGSLLIVRHVSVGSIIVGEVLVFNAPWSPGVTVAHEVIAVLHTSSGLEFRTRGIANPSADPEPVPAANVIGIVAFVIPWVGYLILYLYVVIILTAVGVGGYVAYSMAYPSRSGFRRHRTRLF